MTVVGLASAQGAPGVTTSAILLAAVWHDAILLEANPAGGDLRYWYRDASGGPLRPDLGVMSLLTAPAPWRRPRLAEHLQHLPGGLPVLVGPSGPSQVEALRESWRYLADTLIHLAHPQHDDPDARADLVDVDAQPTPHVVLDAGSLTGSSSLSFSVPLLRACDRSLLVCRATASSLAHTRDLLRLLADLGLSPQVLLIGPPAAAADAARTLDLPLAAVHLLPDAPEHAAGITGPWTRRLDRSPLLRAARELATRLHHDLASSATAADRRSRTIVDLREEVVPS